MTVEEQIEDHLARQPDSKRDDMRALMSTIIELEPGCKLWFLDGRNDEGKVVSNPNIGFGSYTMSYTDGSTREFYQIGLTATTNGISVYIMGIDDKNYLREAYGKDIGKANVTGYCIRFKRLKDINTDVLRSAMRVGFDNSK